MKYFDFGVQALILVFAVILLIVFPSSDRMLNLYFIYLLLGPWQFVGSAIAVLVRAPFFRARRIHLMLSTLWLTVLICFAGANLSAPMSSLFAIPPGLLGLFYFGITTRWVFYQPAKSGFLRHLSF